MGAAQGGQHQSKRRPPTAAEPEPEPAPEPGAAPQPPPPAAPEAAPVRLKRSLNAWDGASIIVGVIVGSGIFVSPKGVLAEAGSVGGALSVWALCGLFASLGALCFAELGTSVEASGGDYTYIRLAYGPLAAYLYLWVTVLVILPCSNAVSALTFANYCLQPFASFIGAASDAAATTGASATDQVERIATSCQPHPMAVRLLALALLISLIYVNCFSLKGSIRLQSSFTLAKVAALGLIISTGLYYFLSGLYLRPVGGSLPGPPPPPQSAQARADPLDPSGESSALAGDLWAHTSRSLPHLARAFYAGFYTYSGWNSLNFVTEEMRQPARDMPRAILLSIGAIGLIYILANGAYFAVLPRTLLLASEAVAVDFGRLAWPSSLAWLMPLTVALSTMGGLNGAIFASSRLLFAGARQGQLPAALGMLHHAHHTPLPSLLVLGLLSALYLCTTDILALINYMVFIEAIFAALAVSTVLVLRRKLPQLSRPIRVPLAVPLIYLTFSFLLIVLPIWSAPSEALIGAALLAAGLPAYYLTDHWKEKPAAYRRALLAFNQLTQKLTLSVAPVAD